VKKLSIVLWLVASACVSGFSQTNIDAIEYFFDSDPGFGNGVSIPITPGPNQNLNFTISTSGLTVGFHTLIVRAKHQSGSWGIEDSRTIYVTTGSVLPTAVLTEMEYYIDNDPGLGNGIDIPVTGTPTVVDVIHAVSTTALTPGFHALHIRAKDADGTWGIPEIRTFYVGPGGITSQGTITQLEYFFDTEPGYGSGTPLTVTAGAQVDAASLISSASLSFGFHTFHIRAKDNDNQWGFAEARTFYVDQLSQVSALEYYIDTDPGEGSATSVSVTTGGAIDVNFAVPTNSLAGGVHTLGVRAAVSDGSWSNAATSTFSVQETQTITFGALAAATFGDAPITLAGTSSSGLALSYASSNPAVATIAGNVVTILGAGTTIITASQAGNANYSMATDIQQTLVVNKANQTISFAALPSKLIGDAPFNLSATSNSSLGVTYSSSNIAVATVSGNTVTIVGAGSTNITASQAGNGNYNAATNVTQPLVVVQPNRPPAIVAPPKDTQAGGNIVFLVDEILSDPDNNLDLTTLKIVSARGASVSISGNVITINYSSIPEYQGVDELTVTVCDFGGECQTELVAVNVGAVVEVFNGISANGDDINKFLRIRFLPTGSQVTIFNRWGDAVYENKDYDSNDPTKRFEGITSDGNELTAGTYFYTITLPGGDKQTGYLQLKR
jgi:CHU_C Type IX secretion signal domain